MAKKKYYGSKCPEPFNTLIDLAGAFAVGAYAKSKIKRDYRKGYGEESAKAATMFYGMGAMHRGSSGLLSLGGLYGVNSALRDIERSEHQPRRHLPVPDNEIDFPSYKTNDNRYAWRLNCEDGSEWGIYPEDFETRDAYNCALNEARGGQPVKTEKAADPEQPENEKPPQTNPLFCCRVSRLDNGSNEYYLTDDDSIRVGDTITVRSDKDISEGVVIAVKRLSEMKPEELPKESLWILAQEDDDGTIEFDT